MKSNLIFSNIGAPQGCALLHIIFSLYTDDCRSVFSYGTILKYADDNVILRKIVNDKCSDYTAQVYYFVEWCKTLYLHMNVKKTEEMIMNYRKMRKSQTLLH